jgi:hypothetical protein
MRQAKSKVKSGLGFHEEFSWQAKQSIPHTAVTFLGDCDKMCEDFAPNFDDKRNGCCFTTHRLTVDQKQHDCHPHPSYSPDSAHLSPLRLLFPRLTINLKDAAILTQLK